MKRFTSILLLTLVVGAFTACRTKEDTATIDSYSQDTSATTTQTDNTETTMQTEPKSGDTIAILKTNMGDIKVLLYTELVPETTKNFIEHANANRYDGTIFHRVIEDFMIQGGDIEHMDGRGGYSYKGEGTNIDDEFGEGLSHIYGALSMANAGPNTGGSQFFIVQKEDGTDWLNSAHAVFGFAYEGMDVVDSIAVVDTMPGDKPTEDIVLEDVVIETF